MKQQQFEQSFAPRWQQFAELLDVLEAVQAKKRQQLLTERAEFPARYRELCGHYAMAQKRHYSSRLVAELQALVLRGQCQLYRHQSHWLWRSASFFLYELPQALARQRRWVLLAWLLFWLPALGLGLACYFVPDTIYMVLDPLAVARFESMYDPASEHLGRIEERAAATNVQMFGFYIWNNVGIGFRSFASGILLGLGSLFLMVFNGVHIGAVAGFLSWRGFVASFWGFVAGHSAFELSAICLCGAAGLVLGKSLLIPGPMRRVDALRYHMGDAVRILVAGMLLLFMAAFVEAFWSPLRSLPLLLKYAVGAGLWLLVLAYLARALWWSPLAAGGLRRPMPE